MLTVREQRRAFLEKIGLDEREFNRSIKDMVAKDSKRDLKKAIKKIKSRRAQRAWKHRKELNGKKETD
jgi:hypothetical protein